MRSGDVPLASGGLTLHRAAMTQLESNPAPRSEAHVASALGAITGLSIAVCLCVAALGLMRTLNQRVAGLVLPAKPESGFRDLLVIWEWIAAGIAALAVSSVLLHTPAMWRRVVFWVASFAVTFAWAPALALCGYAPDVAIPCLAVLASGAGSIFYTSRHRMPCDESD